MVSFATIKSSRVITFIKCQLPKQRNFVWTCALDKSHVIKSRDKNITDFNVADSVRRDIKVLVTKTRYTVVM